VPAERKRALLAALLRDPSFERVLVFTRTKHGADRVVRHLVDAGTKAVAIHGNKSQPQRERALAAFRGGDGRVLVATDIAARGIDVEGVSHVINFELPNVPEDYVHRIGRTARAGAAGAAIAFCSDEERPYLRSIEKLTRLAVPVIPVPAGAREFQAEGAVSTSSASRSEGKTASHRQPAPHARAETGKTGADALPAFVRRHPRARPSASKRPSAPRPRGMAAN
jgi:ATP-dependent RNA helicase RhlE